MEGTAQSVRRLRPKDGEVTRLAHKRRLLGRVRRVRFRTTPSAVSIAPFQFAGEKCIASQPTTIEASIFL